jgi:hypothetical protein
MGQGMPGMPPGMRAFPGQAGGMPPNLAAMMQGFMRPPGGAQPAGAQSSSANINISVGG